MRPKRTWILLADGRTAKIIENCGPGKGLCKIYETDFEFSEKSTHDDQQGRGFSSTSPARYKLEPGGDEDHGVSAQIKKVLTTLEASHSKREFDRLILCAEPHTLGIIRQQLPAQLKPHTIAELSKDLVNVPVNDLSGHFEDVLAV